MRLSVSGTCRCICLWTQIIRQHHCQYSQNRKPLPQADPQIISMIRDGRSLKAKQEVINFMQQYGTSKVLHLTLSPDRLSINQIAQGEFDEQYRDFLL